MNERSKQNILAADFARIEAFSQTTNAVSLWKNGKVSYLHDENGEILFFPTYFAAFNAVFKVRCNISFDQSSRTLSLV